jgi:hypothetical protein
LTIKAVFLEIVKNIVNNALRPNVLFMDQAVLKKENLSIFFLN